MGDGPRSRPAGADFKPPQAARVKSPRGERCWKRRKLFCQVGLEETNASEPLMTCRNVFNRRRNRDLDFCPASKGWGLPADCPTGVRHEGGVTSRQASVRNTGTCRPDAKGETQATSRHEGLSTDAGHRGGPVSPAVIAAFTVALMWAKCASRSGCFPPSGDPPRQHPPAEPVHDGDRRSHAPSECR
jgi:hypothetical protein